LYAILKQKHILTDDEVDFLEALHSVLYFKYGNDKFYLENGVQQGSPISQKLFNVYMEEFLEQLSAWCYNFTFWH
jgi:hypothetical protein